MSADNLAGFTSLTQEMWCQLFVSGIRDPTFEACKAWQRTNFLGRDVIGDEGNHFLLWAHGWGRCVTRCFLVAEERI